MKILIKKFTEKDLVKILSKELGLDILKVSSNINISIHKNIEKDYMGYQVGENYSAYFSEIEIFLNVNDV